MPFFMSHFSEVLSCAICDLRFDLLTRLPCSLPCSHTICSGCLANFRDGTATRCPLDKTEGKLALGALPVNTAILSVMQLDWTQCLTVKERLSVAMATVGLMDEAARHNYLAGVERLEEIASVVARAEALNKPLQRKLMSLFQCQILLEEGRTRSFKAAKSVCERIVIELILQHQNQQQLTSHLWSAVRARGCQFLGPAMQEEVLKLVILALESGSALSRKVLVMFIVQKLQPIFSQASKTSVGHVVQLLYRASCFKVCKCDGHSSLMELKEEFRTYETLRREHDAQVIQIAQEAGLRIAPEQWSSLLYGDQQHKSQMQSIIDKLQTSQFFSQSIQELLVAVQRSGDPENLSALSEALNFLADIDVATAELPSIHLISTVLTHVFDILVAYLRFMATVQDKESTNYSRLLRPANDNSVEYNRQRDGYGNHQQPTMRQIFHQPLQATRSLPHKHIGMNRYGNGDALAESLSVMDLNKTIYRTPDFGVASSRPVVHPSNIVSTHSPLSMYVGRPASRQASAPFPYQPPSRVVYSGTFPPTRLEGGVRLDLPTGLTPSFVGQQPVDNSAIDYAAYRQPVVASSSWSGSAFHPAGQRLPQRFEESRTIPASLSSGSLLDDYSKWRDDAATSNGIHRITSLSDMGTNHYQLQQQHNPAYDQPSARMFFLDDRPALFNTPTRPSYDSLACHSSDQSQLYPV
ncbi:Roquin-1 [Hypsibius exemplaris]|uniref:RING-type E3 ubiquitin transferase n=1 Tax=Hypsibius exemplaris TaxID=2072580 RepID=A0A1W0WR45_HYPEX|nr:Roquin-1 [Hypsibius exemplaris]